VTNGLVSGEIHLKLQFLAKIKNGIQCLSIRQMLKEMSSVKEVINYYYTHDKKKTTKTITFSKSEENFDNIIDKYLKKYNLYQYAYK
jgi:hypothetical protein